MDESPVEYDKKDLSLPQFELVNVSTRHCKDMFKTGVFIVFVLPLREQIISDISGKSNIGKSIFVYSFQFE